MEEKKERTTKRAEIEEFQTERQKFLDMYTNKELRDIVSIPDDVTFNYSMKFPTKGTISKNFPYGDYTVFVTTKGSCYHSKRECCGAIHSMHVFYAVKHHYVACSKCNSNYYFKLPSWYDECTKIMKTIEKYNILT